MISCQLPADGKLSSSGMPSEEYEDSLQYSPVYTEKIIKCINQPILLKTMYLNIF
jgi:hypothetical protein